MIHLVIRNVFVSGLKTAYNEVSLYILPVRSVKVHNLHLKPEMVNGESLIKGCFVLTRATFFVCFYLNQTMHTTKKKSRWTSWDTEYSYLNELLLVAMGEDLISHIKIELNDQFS